MKTKNIITLAALASILSLALILTACNTGAAGDPDLPLQQTYWTSTTDGTIYKLTITQNAAKTAYTPTPGDSYVLDIIKNGVVVNTSRGTVQVYTENTIILLPVYTGAEIFTVLVNNDQIANISGPITVEESNTPVPPPPSNTFVTVTGVTVTPSTATVARNGTQQFTAVVAGTNNPAQTVTWTVSTNQGNVNGTSISETGLLTVGPNQNPTTLIVTATSTVDTAKSGAATVTVSNPGNNGEGNNNKPGEAGGHDGTQGLAFELINNGAAYSVSKGTVTSGAVVIPATYNGLPVKEIAVGGFTGLNITGVTIPSSITSIGDGAFGDCTSLINVTIPSSVTSIRYRAFRYCTSLTNVTISSGVTSTGDGTFENCTSLISVTIPSSVTSIGYDTFSGCSSLTSITIPSSVNSIGSGAFTHSGLTSVTIPSSVKSIGIYAFNNCTNLTSVTISSGVTSIGYAAFRYCLSLANVTIPSSVTSIDFYAFGDCPSLTSVTIPSSVTSIDGVFANCKNLTSVNIPFGVKSISYAFSGCTNLTSVIIPSSVTSIDSHAFYYCLNLTSVTIPSSVTSIGVSAFFGCGFTSFDIPSSVTSIGNDAFRDCLLISSITIPSSVTSLGSAFVSWQPSQTINIQGHASQAAADATWGVDWRSGCYAVINYLGQ